MGAAPFSRLPFARTLFGVVAHLPQFGRLYWRLFRDARVSIWPKALLVLTAAYLVSPLDLVPFFFPVVGQLDDLALLALTLWSFVRLCPPEVVRRHVSDIASETPR